jgi:hypothetical protein
VSGEVHPDEVVGDCPACWELLMQQGFALVEAFASVAIAQGRSSADMARSYFAAYHRRGHRE